jgi:hypothetical protein
VVAGSSFTLDEYRRATGRRRCTVCCMREMLVSAAKPKGEREMTTEPQYGEGVQGEAPPIVQQVATEILRKLIKVGIRAELGEVERHIGRRQVRLRVEEGEDECPELSLSSDKWNQRGRIVLAHWWPTGCTAPREWSTVANSWVHPFSDVTASQSRPPATIATDLLRRGMIREYIAAWIGLRDKQREAERQKRATQETVQKLVTLAGEDAGWVNSHHGDGFEGHIQGLDIEVKANSYRQTVEVKMQGLTAAEAEQLIRLRLAQEDERPEPEPEPEDEDEDTQEEEDLGEPEGPEDEDAGQADSAEWKPPAREEEAEIDYQVDRARDWTDFTDEDRARWADYYDWARGRGGE